VGHRHRAAAARAADLLITGQERLRTALGVLARKHRDTLTVARTHGVHAEPTTFGLKVAVWYVEAGRNLERPARRARPSPSASSRRGRQLRPRGAGDRGRGLSRSRPRREPVSTQIVQRDRHAEFATALALAGASLEKIALEVRGLQRTEVLEAQEPFGEGQKGSSAMPTSATPSWPSASAAWPGCCAPTRWPRWRTSRCGTSGHQPLLVERVILPDSTILLDYILDLTTFIVEGPRRRSGPHGREPDLSQGNIYSQRVLLKLTESGLARQVAYELVQRHAMRAWKERRPLLELLAADPAVTERLGPADLKACFDPAGSCATSTRFPPGGWWAHEGSSPRPAEGRHHRRAGGGGAARPRRSRICRRPGPAASASCRGSTWTPPTRSRRGPAWTRCAGACLPTRFSRTTRSTARGERLAPPGRSGKMHECAPLTRASERGETRLHENSVSSCSGHVERTATSTT
jgi:adenylosuccinate lyase